MIPYSFSGAAGGVHSIINDMLNYERIQLNETSPVVSLSHQPTWGDIRYYAIELNWQMDSNPSRRIFQSGGTTGFSSFMAIYPDPNIAVILFSNESDKNTQGALSEIAQRIMTYLMPI